MCGICGSAQVENLTENLLRQMNNQLLHRGPDGEGLYCAEGVGLAMRRLAIIDVGGSEQPLYNEDRSIALVFNGEIYNFQALRQDLANKGHRFHTEGDGETIAHLYEEYGEDAPKYLRGMFAFALWDSRKKKLLLGRDRFGKKPLYYYHKGETLVFGSEIKALLEHPAVPRESAFDRPEMLALYLSYGYIPAPMTAFKQIKMLPPASTVLFEKGTISIRRYWDLPAISNEESSLSLSEAAEQVRELLRESVRLRMIADVPLGAFLSGGLDSSLIVALMQEMSSRPIKTFSIGFSGDESFDESPYAEQVAKYLKTDHHSFRVEPQAMDLLEKLVWHHDQPFADSSAIPTFLVSQLTRQHVTVALTGDGGDELFAGYERFYAAALVNKMGIVPKPVWQFGAALLSALPEGTGYYNRIKRAGRFLRGAAQDLPSAYFDWIRVADAEMLRALPGREDTALTHFKANYLQENSVAAILEANQASYLPDDLLIKADRSSMAASLEARAPFLDHELAELVAPMPLSHKMRGSKLKVVLKEAARGLLPESIIHRKKHGFGVPLGTWLRKDISPVKDLLLSHKARQRGLMNVGHVEKLINEHETGQRDHNRILWTLLTLEQWHRGFMAN
jgi:asparagine synthase (glutamine-hydrolysing)